MAENEAINIKDLKGTELDLKNLPENERSWRGALNDMEDKKTGNGKPYWIFSAAEDEMGRVVRFVTFSSTIKAIIEDALTNERALTLVYQLPEKYGSFTLVSAELPDGTFSAKEAREAWKKGNKANNRAQVITAAAMVSGKEAGTDEVIAVAEILLKWVEKEDK